MEAALTVRPSGDNLWKAAVESVGDDLKAQIDFKQESKIDTLGELLSVTEKAKKRLTDRAWSFKRSSGEKVIVRDVLGKVAKWVNLVKQVGDFAVQFDPGHAGVAWAGIRFMLTVAVGDLDTYKGMFETTADIAEYICRTAVLESLVRGKSSQAADELSRAIIKLYIAILTYLSRATAYCNQNTFKRILKYGVLVSGDLESSFAAVAPAQDIVSRCALVMNLEGKSTVPILDKLCACSFTHILKAQLDSQVELRRIRESFDAPMQRWDGALHAISDQLEAEQRKKILQWMSAEPYIQHHKQTKSEVLKGTGNWLLQNPSFLRWKNESASSILWIRGIPGSGKSKLMSIAIEDAMGAFQRKQSPQPAYFYCSRNPAEPGRSDPSRILASIARQLATPEVGGAILEPAPSVYNEREAQAFADGPLSLEESKELVIKLLDQYKDATMTIAIDGLDECNEDTRGDLLEAFEFLLEESPCLLKLLVSSRDDQDIVYQFENYPCLALSSAHSSSDIELFVASEVKKLLNSRFLRKTQSGKEALSEKIVKELTAKADGMFRWVSLQMQALQKCHSEEAIMERLGQLPRTLGDLYQELIVKMENFEATSDRDLAKNSLSWLLCSHAQLASEAFLAAVSTSKDGESEAISRDQLLDLCCNLVIFDEALDVFRFAHLSVREFLEKHDLFRPESINSRVAEACLVRIVGATPDMDLQDETNPSIEALWYSYVYWGYHTQAAAKERSPVLDDLLAEFLSDEDNPSSSFGLWDQAFRNGTEYSKWTSDPPLILYDCFSPMPCILLPVCAFDICGVISLHEWKSLAEKGVTSVLSKTPIELAVGVGSVNIIQWVFDNDIPTPFTDQLLACLSWAKGTEMLKMFLAKYGSEFPITEEFVGNAAFNENCGYEMMKLLVDTRGAELPMAAEVVESAVCNPGSDDHVLKLLRFVLDKIEGDFVLTEHTLGVVARETERGEQVLQILLKKFGNQRIPVSQEILLEAARNEGCGDKLIALFLKHFGEQVEITEELVNNAAANNAVAFSLLLQEWGPSAQISNRCLQLAAEYNWQSLALLLEKYADAVVISQDTVKAAARNPGSLKLLDQKRGTEFQITDEIVEIAAISHSESLDYLLKNRASEAKLNENIVIKAVRHNVRVLEFLLDEYGHDIEITEEIVKAAAQYSLDALEVLFDKRGDDIMVNEDILLAVAMAFPSQFAVYDIGQLISMFMAKNKADTIASITPRVCSMSVACGDENGLECFRRHLLAEAINPAWDSICRFHVAAKEGNLEIVETLLKEPIPLDTKDYLGQTPLYLAARYDRPEVVKLLVHDKRVNVNALSIFGRSPLFEACKYSCDEVVEVLLAAGAETHFIDADGETALSAAIKGEHDNIVKLLEGKS
ncbi:unnamed protein product [Clonostachys rosea]|uniref:NWD NACHT-NTPase N-terminal domain-containing protein n=1 Tax=Bionectria ochroleuca TaxID=29856 RepID=A0ABY6U481_BIOOC|nr:unnamed protein product [Clonostachys rosea]